MKRIFALLIGLTMMVSVLAACGSSEETAEKSSSDTSTSSSESGTESVTLEESALDTVSKVDVDTDKVKDLINIQEVSIPAGSDASDFMKAIDHDTTKVNYVSYDLNSIDMNTPGEYEVRVSINMPVEDALDYVDASEIDDDAVSVDLATTFNVTVTESEESADSDKDIVEDEIEATMEPAGEAETD